MKNSIDSRNADEQSSIHVSFLSSKHFLLKFLLFLVVFGGMWQGLQAAESDTVWVKDMKQFGETQVNDIRFSQDDKYAFVLTSGGVYMFETETGSFVKSFLASNLKKMKNFATFDIFNNGTMLINSMYQDSLLIVWDINKGDTVKTIKMNSPGTVIKLSYNDELIYFDLGDSVVEFSIEPWKYQRTLTKGLEQWNKIICSNDYKYIASGFKSGTNYFVRIFDAKTLQMQSLYSHPDNIADLKFSNDSKYIASCGWKNSIIIWDLENNMIKDTIKTKDLSNDIYALSFSPDTKNIVFGVPSMNKSYIYNLETKKIIYEYNFGNSRLESSKNSKFILSTTGRYFRLLNAKWDINNNDNIDTIFRIISISPNPVTGKTAITLEFPFTAFFDLKIIDELGKLAFLEQNKYHEKGKYTLEWDVSSVPSGVYFCRITSSGFARTIKLIVTK